MKTFNLQLISIVALLAMTTIAWADEAKPSTSVLANIGDLGKAAARKVKPGGVRSAVSYGSSVRTVLASESTIEAGNFKDYGEVPIDFAGAENLAVSISASNGSLVGITILVAWAAPDEYFVATDFIKGSSLVSKMGGGGRVPVYGPGLRILVANDGTAPVTIRQLAVYAFLH